MMGEGGGVEGDRGGGVCCLLDVPEACSCQVNVLQCTLEGVETVVGKDLELLQLATRNWVTNWYLMIGTQHKNHHLLFRESSHLLRLFISTYLYSAT